MKKNILQGPKLKRHKPTRIKNKQKKFTRTKIKKIQTYMNKNIFKSIFKQTKLQY